MSVLATLETMPRGAALRAERRADESPLECRKRLRQKVLRQAIAECRGSDDLKIVLVRIVEWM